MRSRILSMALLSALVGGCTPVPHTQFVGDHHFVCIDGVEYFDEGSAVPRHNPTPHLKPDGKPYTCNY